MNLRAQPMFQFELKIAILLICILHDLLRVHPFTIPTSLTHIPKTKSKDCYSKRYIPGTNVLIRTWCSSSTTESNAKSVHTSDLSIRTPQSKIDEILHNIQKQHNDEVQRGFDTFMNQSSESQRLDKMTQWTDDDFLSYDVGIGNAGPDEFHMKNGNQVFATTKPVFTPSECECLIAEAKTYIDAGLQKQQPHENAESQITNSALGEAKVSTLPQTLAWLKTNMKHKLIPLLESRFGLVDLTLNDALIIGYGYLDSKNGGGSQSQPIHRDASLVSLNVALSPRSNYNSDGGGTYFEGLNVGPEASYSFQNDGQSQSHGPIMMEQGHVLCHSSGAMHAGNGIQMGERWVLVLFCLAKSIPQLARRCHYEGMKLTDDGDLELARATFEAGLTQAPNDHLLHMSIGRIYSMQGNDGKAQEYLEKTAQLYKLDPNPLIALGKMYLSQRKGYQAFCQFDKVLSRINNADLFSNAWMPLKAAAWDARVHAGRCAVICAEEEASNNLDGKLGTESEGREQPFALQHLPEAIKRIEIALDASPQDERLIQLLARAKELLHDATPL